MNIPYVSLNLGLFDWLIQSLVGIIASAINIVITLLTSIFSRMLYAIGTQLMWLADFAQGLFRKMAGLESYWYGGVAQETVGKDGVMIAQDPLLKVLTSPAVLEVMLALLIVAVSMLILATVIQILRVEYTSEGAQNSKGKIIGKTLKALVTFAIVPIGALGGILISNFLLLAVDGATNQSGSQYISGTIFIASASEANRVRGIVMQGEEDPDEWFQKIFEAPGIIIDSQARILNGSDNSGAPDNPYVFKVETNDAFSRRAILAERIDYAFANKIKNNNLSSSKYNATLGEHFDYMNVDLVEGYYNLTKVNYIILFAGSVMAIKVLYMAVFGLVMRLYKATVLFVISPPIIALMPLDNGSAFTQWRKQFIGAVVGAYGTVVSLNLLFIILPILKNIQLFDPSKVSNYYFNNFTYLIFVIVGLMMLEKLSSMISNLIGGDDVLAGGKEMSGKVTAAAGKVVGAGAGLAIGGAGALGKGAMGLMQKGRAISAMSGSKKALAAGDGYKAETLLAKSDALNESASNWGGSAMKTAKKSIINPAKDLTKKGAGAVAGAMGIQPTKDQAESLKSGMGNLGHFAEYGTFNKEKGKAIKAQEARDKKEKRDVFNTAIDDAKGGQDFLKNTQNVQNLKQETLGNFNATNVMSNANQLKDMQWKFDNALQNDDFGLATQIADQMQGMSLDTGGGFELINDSLIKLINEVKDAGGVGGGKLKDSTISKIGDVSGSISDYITNYQNSSNMIYNAVSNNSTALPPNEMAKLSKFVSDGIAENTDATVKEMAKAHKEARKTTEDAKQAAETAKKTAEADKKSSEKMMKDLAKAVADINAKNAKKK